MPVAWKILPWPGNGFVSRRKSMRRIHISKLALLAAALLVLFAGNAMAGVVFDLSPTN